jgi:hypothetical protein
VRDYSGTIAGQSLGNVTIHFSLLGGIQGLQDLANQNTETTAGGSNLTPTVAVSSASPGAVGLSASGFTILGPTLVVPYAFINPGSGYVVVTNLTQRQAAYLEGAAGTNSAGALPISFFGGTSTDPIYLVARNTASAVRTEIDANIDFTGTISTWTTNSLGQPVPDPSGGQSSGSNVRALLKAIGNAIGTVAASDISTDTTLSYEGVPYSITNVENGSYPLWGLRELLHYQQPAMARPAPRNIKSSPTCFRR